MTVTALLRDPSGFQREYSTEWDESDRDIVVFMWEDAIYACDCNRAMWLYDLSYDHSRPCGKTIRCVSLKIEGEEVYSEAVALHGPPPR